MRIKRDSKIIIISLAVAICLSILILPSWAQYFRPLWVLLALVYFSLYMNSKIGVGVAWSMGCLLDLLNGTLLGEHALALIVVVYLVLALQRQIRMFPLWQQSATVFVLSLIYLIIIYIVQNIINAEPASFLYWLPALTTAILWPWVSMLITNWHKGSEAVF